MNYDYELEKHYHPENFMTEEEKDEATEDMLLDLVTDDK